MLNVTIAAVDRIIFEGEVKSITCPGSLGELTVLGHHEPLITTLTKGNLVIRCEGRDDESIKIEKGILEVSLNHATILV